MLPAGTIEPLHRGGGGGAVAVTNTLTSVASAGSMVVGSATASTASTASIALPVPGHESEPALHTLLRTTSDLRLLKRISEADKATLKDKILSGDPNLVRLKASSACVLSTHSTHSTRNALFQRFSTRGVHLYYHVTTLFVFVAHLSTTTRDVHTPGTPVHTPSVL